MIQPAIVVDSSTITDALTMRELRDLRAELAVRTLHAPALLDYEVLSAVRGLHLGGHLGEARARDALIDFGDLKIRRQPMTTPLREAAFELRHRMTAYDASYAALAQALGVQLWTRDRPFARACSPALAYVPE